MAKKRVEYNTDYEIGEDNIKLFGMDMHNPVFMFSAILILLFVIVTIMFPEASKEMWDCEITKKYHP